MMSAAEPASEAVVHVPFASMGVFLIVACLIAMVTRRFGWPYTVGLVAAGIGIAYIPELPPIPLSRDLIFYVLLPPLVFEAALQLQWKPFRRELPVSLLLAFAGVALAAAVVTIGMHSLVGWSWIGAALFGVLIAATDPVSVIATFRELKVQPRLTMLVESESLLNDGVAAVGFAVLAGIAAGGSATASTIIPTFLWTLFGGAAIGALVALAVLAIAGRTSDHLVEITLTTLAAYASFLCAEQLHASGVLASLTAGLVVGNFGRFGAIDRCNQDNVRDAWEYFAFLANSFVFLLIGVHEATQPLHQLGWYTGAIAILLVLAGRVVAVYPLSAIFRGSRLAIPVRYQHVLFWGGLRGALALALALALPASVPERLQIIVTAFLVVAFSIFVQGLTMPWLIKRFGLGTRDDDDAVAARQS
jgi:monovalent cation:H+ antiporter, CPA1 family